MRAHRRPNEAAGVLLERVRSGDQGALSRALSLVCDEREGYESVIKEFFRFHGGSPKIGFCGSPGSGKSSVLNALITAMRSRGETAAVLAVDPSSSFTGGAFLGDRIRSQQHALDSGVFFRSLATRGVVGGLSETIFAAIHVLEAYRFPGSGGKGFDRILIETVGTGQDEVEVADVVDTVVNVSAPYQGDEFQAMKAGTMEIADIFAVNKADLEEVDRAVAVIKDALSLGPELGPEQWEVPVLAVSARTGKGIPDLDAAISAHFEQSRRTGVLIERRRRQMKKELASLVSRTLARQALNRVTERHIQILMDKASDPLTLSGDLIGAGS